MLKKKKDFFQTNKHKFIKEKNFFVIKYNIYIKNFLLIKYNYKKSMKI